MHYLMMFDTWTDTLDRLPLSETPPIQEKGGWREATECAMWMAERVNAFWKAAQPNSRPLYVLFTTRHGHLYPTVVYEHPTEEGWTLVAYIQTVEGERLGSPEPQGA